MNKYKSNSFKSREGTPKVHSLVSMRKKSLGERVSDELISDNAKGVKDYVFDEVVIPLIKKGINDGVTGALRMILYGNTKANRITSTSSHVSYKKYYDDAPARQTANYRSSGRVVNTDIIVEEFNEAKGILEELKDYLAADGIVSVARYFEITDAYRQGIVERDYMHNSFGWSSLSAADILPYGNRWMIKLPRPLPID